MITQRTMKNEILVTPAGAMAGSSIVMSTSAGAMAGSSLLASSAGAMAGSTILADSSGVMAGSAVPRLEIKGDGKRELRIVTATVNDVCQLRCGHCYLGESADRNFMDQATQDVLASGGYNHLAIVGKEPFFNKEHVRKTSDLVRKLTESGITTSVITNGMNLDLVPTEVLRSLAYLDVSVDAGNRESYQALRPGGNWDKLLRNVTDAKNRAGIPINGLHTVQSGNINELGQMAAVSKQMPLDLLLFSPFTQTQRRGADYVTQPVDALRIIEAANQSPEFRDNPKAFLYLGIYKLPEADKETLRGYIAEKGVRAILINESPLNLGVMRVTHDGKIMTPDESLHTKLYASASRRVQDKILSREYQKLVGSVA